MRTDFMSEYEYDIFISYSRSDIARVEVLVNYLTDVGFTVFWDAKIDDFVKFKSFLQQKLQSSGVVLVCWTENSKHSDWVEWEAGIAKELDRYLPITLDGYRPERDSQFHIRSIKNWHIRFKPKAVKDLAYNIASRLGKTSKYNITTAEERIDTFSRATQLALLWFLVSLTTTYYSVSMWIASQNKGLSPLGMLINSHPIKGSLISVFLVGILSIISLRLLRSYSQLHLGETFFARMPRTLYEPRAAGNPVIKALAYSKIVLTLLPVAAVVHFFGKITRHGDLVLCREMPPIKVDLWEFPDKLYGHNYCFGHGTRDAATDGVTFLPFVWPLLILLVLTWLTYEFLLTSYFLLRPRSAN